ncbi:hypothetical protein [Anaerorhabdus sp.]|uniref:hypothetical protein n=1 Tax=Anaerorhabdus sp. TaxID=1872524 RepID=UPI002FC6F566
MIKCKLPFPNYILIDACIINRNEKDEYGNNISSILFNGRCCYTEKNKVVRISENESIHISGILILKGNIEIEKHDTVEIDDKEMQVQSFVKPKNPDGSVFSTEIYLL